MQKLREETLALYRQLGDHWSTASVLRSLPLTLLPLGRLEEARARQDEGLELARRLGDERLIPVRAHYPSQPQPRGHRQRHGHPHLPTDHLHPELVGLDLPEGLRIRLTQELIRIVDKK